MHTAATCVDFHDVFSTVSRILVFVGVLDNCFVLCVVIFNENSR